VATPPLDSGVALALLRTMWRIRRFEERVAQLTRSRRVHGLVHLSIGGEGVAAAVCQQLRDDDAVYTGHRAHGHAIAKGAPLGPLMAELMGRVDGLCHGLGGSMHVVDIEHGLLGATGVVGGNIPLALGTGLAARLRGCDRVTVVFFGDGAAQSGHFAESVNLAALWALPVILVCENNGFAEFTPRSTHTPIELVSDAVAPYGFVRQTVDGSDAGAVWTAFAEMLASAREGRGPMLLECLTHRRRGHYEGDAETYRDQVAEDEWARRDPVARLGADAIAVGWIDEAGIAALADEAADAAEEAVAFARRSPFPEPELMEQLVYADG
jgi:acetoin:2,6-dichlorophenolindophenol oxidoreductase subunit alpha